MNLLPKSHQDFSQKEYWNTFFTKRGKKAFEWYGEYPELCGQLHKYIKNKDDILIIGCGNSTLSTDLYDVGFKNITNIDISKVVIRQMQEINRTERPDMKYLQMDVMSMSFEDEKFSVILDKGTLDALMPNDEKETVQQIEKMFSEINRVLKVGGRYVCVSLLQEHILKQLLEYFPKNNWMFRVVRCHEAEKKSAENGETTMPVFVVVCSKFKQLPTKILETCLAGDKMQRLSSTDEVVSSILSVQEAAMVCSGLNKNNIVGQDEISLDLFRPGENIARFTIYILDQQFDRKNGQYAAFIVPQGRETEWLFSTKEGRKKLLKSAQFNRLSIVTMHRNQKYDSLDAIKEELNDTVLNLAPANVPKTIPYISLGDDVGQREIRYEGTSEFSGPFVVEDVTSDGGQIFRRLIFLDNRNIVQSEAKLKNVKQRGNKRKLLPDACYLACQHHTYMSVGVQAACTTIKNKTTSQKQKSNDVLLIGLGGGGLCTFLNHSLPDVDVTAVEIDPAMVQVAKDFFGLQENDKLKIVVEDGLKFIKKAAEEGVKFKAILFDVDSKDSSMGMSCPPKEFLEQNVLKNVNKCIGNEGMFVLNLVLRDETLRDLILKSLKSHFKSITSYKLEEDLNEILFCKNVKVSDVEQWRNEIKTAAEQLNSVVRKRKLQNDDLVDVISLTESLKMYD